MFMKKLLVPIDGSPPSIKAAEQALTLAKAFDSKVTFLTIVEDKTLITNIEDAHNLSKEYFTMIDSTTRQEKEYAVGLLDEIVGSLDCGGIQTEQRVAVGNIVSRIIEIAEKGSYELIIMGYRGLNPFQRLFVGSVAKRVIEYAPCSVLVVR